MRVTPLYSPFQILIFLIKKAHGNSLTKNVAYEFRNGKDFYSEEEKDSVGIHDVLALNR